MVSASRFPAAVQRILRHSDPRITTEVYGHLVPGYLQDEVDRLRFGEPSNDLQAVSEAPSQLVTSLLQDPANEASTDDQRHPIPVELPLLSFLVGHEGLEPSASGLRDLSEATSADVPSVNSAAACTPSNVERHEMPTQDAQPGHDADPVEASLARAIDKATDADRFDVVAQLCRELEARRLARTPNVVRLDSRRGARS